jgi:phospholipase C
VLKASAALGVAGLAGLGATAEAATPTALPTPAASGIEHIVVVMMENRSFDHFLGWLPGADGKQSGLTFTDRYGLKHTTHHLTDYASCAYNDPVHSYEVAGSSGTTAAATGG